MLYTCYFLKAGGKDLTSFPRVSAMFLAAWVRHSPYSYSHLAWSAFITWYRLRTAKYREAIPTFLAFTYSATPAFRKQKSPYLDRL